MNRDLFAGILIGAGLVMFALGLCLLTKAIGSEIEIQGWVTFGGLVIFLFGCRLAFRRRRDEE